MEQQRDEYVHRINRVMDYMEAHVGDDLTLQELAHVAEFSPFHFHRIFGAMVGETLFQFLQRIRVEKAAMKLLNNPREPVTRIAMECGFSGSPAFARAFKETFGMSATQWRSGGHEKYRNLRKAESKASQATGNPRKDPVTFSFYIDSAARNHIWRTKVKHKNLIQVEVKDMPALEVAYMRHIGPYQGDSQLFQRLTEKLMMWAGPRGLLRFPETQLIAVYHDDPEITAEEKLRVSMCITVPEDTPGDGEIGRMTVPGGKFALARFELADDEYQEAWDTVFGSWLPQSGYQPDDRLCYELYRNNPEEHPEKKCIVDICVPVKPL